MKLRNLLPILALVLFISTELNGQDKIKWYQIDEALQLASKEPRILVIDVYTDWCGWCKRMDASTFSDPKVIATMNEKFYPVKLDAEQKEDIVISGKVFKFVASGRRGYHELAAIVTKGRLSYPTISYIDSRGRVLEAVPGYKGPEQFLPYLNYYLEADYEKVSFTDWQAANQPEETEAVRVPIE